MQDFLQRELRARWPQVQFLGEESACAPDFSGSVWVLDPVDGTANLMHHFQHSAVSLALVEAGQPVFGVVYNPFLAETFTAQRGRGAYLNGAPLRVSTDVPAADSVIAVGTSPYDRQLADENFALFRRLFERCGDLRRHRLGGAGPGLCGRWTGGGISGAQPEALGFCRGRAAGA